MSLKRIFVFPGSFDPVTIGHRDIIMRASRNCDLLYVAILNNVNKKGHFFSLEDRLYFLRNMTKDIENVRVVSFDGLLIDFCRQNNCCCIVKGVRNASDFEYEINMADINANLSAHSVDTVFYPAKQELSHISSSVVRELIHYHADISRFVNEDVINRLREM